MRIAVISDDEELVLFRGRNMLGVDADSTPGTLPFVVIFEDGDLCFVKKTADAKRRHAQMCFWSFKAKHLCTNSPAHRSASQGSL